MKPLHLKIKAQDVILFLAPHCDDVEIGCGGLALQLQHENLGERICVTFTGDEQRRAEARAAALAFGLRFEMRGPYDDRFLPDRWSDVLNDLFKLKNEIEAANKRIAAVFYTRADDRHQDHRVIGENVRRVFRDHLIFEYETPNYDGNLAKPNFFVPLPEEIAEQKARLICQSYQSRRCHSWWGEDIFLALMRLRGCEANAKYAEGFVAPKLVGQFLR